MQENKNICFIEIKFKKNKNLNQINLLCKTLNNDIHVFGNKIEIANWTRILVI